MSLSDRDCRYCSIVSQRNGEDPIGSASEVNEWLFVTVPRPWGSDVWHSQPQYQALVNVVESLSRDPDRYLKTRLQAIILDRQSLPDGEIRVMYYKRPARHFATYIKSEYVISLDRATSLVNALLFQPSSLADFTEYVVPEEEPNLTRDLFICTHTQYDIACGRFGAPLHQTLVKKYANSQVRIWQVNHFGGHQFAPTLLDFPTGQWWAHLTPDVLETLMDHKGTPEILAPLYRGWSGTSKFGQMADRELWLKQGWDWLHWSKTFRIKRWIDRHFWQSAARPILNRIPWIKAKLLLSLWERNALGAIVEVRATDPTGKKYRYQIQVHTTGTIETKLESGDGPTTPALQYRSSEIITRNQQKQHYEKGNF